MFAQFVATATGTLYALMSDDVHARHSWQNATTCAPRCGPLESCCSDPQSQQTTPLCMKVASCSDVVDDIVSYPERLVRFDFDAGVLASSPPLPLPEKSGASLPPVVIGAGQLVTHIFRAPVGGPGPGHPSTPTLVRYDVSGATPQLGTSCDLPVVLQALFYSGKQLYGVPLNDGRSILAVEPPGDSEHAACAAPREVGRLPSSAFVNSSIPSPAANAVLDGVFYYLDVPSASVIGVTLPSGAPPALNASLSSLLPSGVGPFWAMHAVGPRTLVLGPSHAVPCGEDSEEKCLIVLDVVSGNASWLPLPDAWGFLWTASPAGEVWYQARTADKNVVPQLAAVALNGSVVRRSAPLKDSGCPDDAIGCDVQFLFADGA